MVKKVDRGYWGRYEGSGVYKNMIRDREGWRERIRVANLTSVGLSKDKEVLILNIFLEQIKSSHAQKW